MFRGKPILTAANVSFQNGFAFRISCFCWSAKVLVFCQCLLHVDFIAAIFVPFSFEFVGAMNHLLQFERNDHEELITTEKREKNVVHWKIVEQQQIRFEFESAPNWNQTKQNTEKHKTTGSKVAKKQREKQTAFESRNNKMYLHCTHTHYTLMPVRQQPIVNLSWLQPLCVHFHLFFILCFFLRFWFSRRTIYIAF